MIEMISLGAGVQSSTMALMAAKGEITPMPEFAIFADTQSEPQAVYRWLDWLETQLPFPVVRVTAGNLMDHELTANARDGRAPLMLPYRTINNGKVGMLRRQCTRHFKVAPIDREIQKRRQGEQANLWIGISQDEAQRMKPPRQKYKRHRYPLIDAGMTRGHCLEWMRNKGYPQPPRSACWFCPYKSNEEWRETAEIDQAIAFDDAMRNRAGDRPIYIHRDARPLSSVDLTSPTTIDLFGNECEGMCGV
jgi:hypothetical protein